MYLLPYLCIAICVSKMKTFTLLQAIVVSQGCLSSMMRSHDIPDSQSRVLGVEWRRAHPPPPALGREFTRRRRAPPRLCR